MAADTDPAPSSYLDPTALLAPTFTPYSYAHALVHRTNNPSDTPLDLSTPLARVLFDAQEADTLIDSLATRYAGEIVDDAATKAGAASRVLEGVEAQVERLREGYERLEREVGERYIAAEEVRGVAERLVRTLRLGRGVQRVLVMGRQLEGLMGEVRGVGGEKGGKNRAMVEAARTVVGLKGVLARQGKGEEGEGLARIGVVNALRGEVLAPAERGVLGAAQQVVREFSMSSLLAAGAGSNGSHNGTNNISSTGTANTTQTFAQAEETKNKATAALSALYLLSPIPPPGTTPETFTPTFLIQALNAYLHAAITSSIAALARALATMPTLDRTLLEISARCQNIVALESLLSSTKPPAHPLLSASTYTSTDDETPGPSSNATNLLHALLKHLDTASLPSYFWRSMASQLSPRVQEILTRGGVSARTLRSNQSRVRAAVRECVDRGSKSPSALGVGKGAVSWEREAAVMVQSVIGPMMK